MPEYIPRYVAYAKAHGHEPEEQLEKDRVDWHGAVAIPFSFWLNERIVEYARINRDAFLRPILTKWDRHGGRPQLIDQEAFDAWLEARDA